MTTAQTQTDDPRLATIADVLAYLKGEGWRATQTSVYRHQKEGKFQPRDDGLYRQRDIDRYAKAWLRQTSTGKRVSEKTDELQRNKLELELQSLRIDGERKKFAHDKDLGKYIPKEQMELEMAARAGILDAGMKHLIQSRAADWVRAVGGEMKKIGDLINMMTNDWNEHLNNYATIRDYEIFIDEAEEAEIKNEEEISPEC